jgi:hypothetical protein
MTKLKIQFPFTMWTGRISSVCNYILIIYNLSVSFMAVKSIKGGYLDAGRRKIQVNEDISEFEAL